MKISTRYETPKHTRENAPTLHTTFYRFMEISDPAALKDRIFEFCKKRLVRGSVILSPEGFNAYLSGHFNAIEEIKTWLAGLFSLSVDSLESKDSWVDFQPYEKLIVKVRDEIISVGEIDSTAKKAPYVDPKTLKTWLDDGTDVLLLDARNDYEVRVGTFKHSLDLGIRHSRNFSDAVKRLEPELKKKKVVTFCTGGIRCEKAGTALLQAGFEEVYQLKGGILNYFESVGKSHWEGDCFVFDQRVAVDASLKPAPFVQCYRCRSPLTQEEQKDPSYVKWVSCPHCL